VALAMIFDVDHSVIFVLLVRFQALTFIDPFIPPCRKKKKKQK
jgi:hypothetical protein